MIEGRVGKMLQSEQHTFIWGLGKNRLCWGNRIQLGLDGEGEQNWRLHTELEGKGLTGVWGSREGALFPSSSGQLVESPSQPRQCDLTAPGGAAVPALYTSQGHTCSPRQGWESLAALRPMEK